MSWIRFDDPEVDRQFRLDSLGEDTRRAVAIETVWTLTIVAYVANDLALLHGPTLTWLLAARALVVAVSVATVLLFLRSRNLALRDTTLFGAIVLQIGLGLLVNATRSRNLMPPVATNVVAILTVWALLPLPFRLQALSAGLVTASTVITVLFLRRALLGTEAVMVTIELLLANTVGVTVSLLTNRDRRERWAAVRERLEAQRELADARVNEVQAQLVQVQRAGGMGSLAVALAHEIGQPLTAVRNGAFAARSYLDRENPNVAGALGALDGVAASALRGAEIIQRMRDYLRSKDLRREPVTAEDVARNARALVGHAASHRGIEFTVDVGPDLRPVQGDEVQLVQVAVIALVNAMDALAGVPGPRRIRLWAQHRGAQLEMGVDDTGPGFSAGVRERLFEPFFTTKAQGMGMGLPIARTIVEAHGGIITADEAPGGGARVAWAIPVEEAGTAGP